MSDEIGAGSVNRGRIARLVRDPGGWVMPALISGLLHGAALLMLWGGGWPEPEVEVPSSWLQTQLMTLAYQVSEPEFPVELPPVEPPPVMDPEPVVDQAAIARKRVEEQERKRKEEQRELIRQESMRQEQLAEKKRLEEQQRQHEQELARQQAEEERAQQSAREARALADAEAEAGRREAEFMAQYQPIHKAPPAYPRRALDSRTEGDCTVIYTVTPDGRVSNPKVVEEACDDPIFIRPSLQAASAFRYQPRIVNGRAVAVHDVRNTFRYRIQ